jgi:hypothetical protein
MIKSVHLGWITKETFTGSRTRPLTLYKDTIRDEICLGIEDGASLGLKANLNISPSDIDEAIILFQNMKNKEEKK